MSEIRFNDYAAENFIRMQRLSVEWRYATEEWKNEARQFCIKGLTEISVLQDIKKHLEDAQENGVGFEQFKRELLPQLRKDGWLGETDKEIGHRLRTIYHTNMASANASSLWQEIQETKQDLPYLQYMASVSAEPRKEHQAFYGLIAKADDPIWEKIFPPNGYGCNCSVRQLSEEEALRLIAEQEKNGGRIWADEKAINEAVDSSFQYNHADLSGFNDSIVNRELTKEEKEQGKTVEQKKEENLQTANGILRTLFEQQGLKEIKEDNFKGQAEILAGYKNYKELMKNLRTSGLELVNKYEKQILMQLEEGKKPYEIFTPILEELGYKKGKHLNYFSSQNADKFFVNNVDEAFSRLPAKLIEKINSSGLRLFVNQEMDYNSRSFFVLPINQSDLDVWKNRIFSQNRDFINRTGEKINSDNAKIADAFILLNEKTEGGIKTTAVHEGTHYLQYFFPEIQEIYKTFFHDRTADKYALGNRSWRLDEITKLNYDIDEKAVADSFSNPYMGKTYHRQFFWNNRVQPLELMTMGFQAILGDNPEDLKVLLLGNEEIQYELFDWANKKFVKRSAVADKEFLGLSLAVLARIGR